MNPRTCATCRWAIDTQYSGTTAKCTAPQGASVTGFDEDRIHKWCSLQRKHGWFAVRTLYPQSCGREGRWWQAKASDQ